MVHIENFVISINHTIQNIIYLHELSSLELIYQYYLLLLKLRYKIILKESQLNKYSYLYDSYILYQIYFNTF